MLQRGQGQSNTQQNHGRTTGENHFDMDGATPITFQAFGYSEGTLPRQQCFCMSRTNSTGFTEARFDIRDGEHCVSQSTPTGGQPYCNPTTSIGMTPLYASEPAPLHENWGFQPDPNIEGHWTAVLQSRGPPPGRQQNAQMEYNMNYPEPPSEFQYQVSFLCGHYSAESYPN